MAIRGSAKCLTMIRRLVQAYALARPAVRFRLRVLKAKNNKSDFVYAPKANANVEDAALKIIGKECALQCDWSALELENFELHAFMPKPDAIGTKIANHGAFISVDCRPVSPNRGTLKKIAAAVRDKIRKANQTLAGVKDPFFCLNIICPIDSYDPNIEPAKDDVIFNDEGFIMGLIDRLIVSYYPKDNHISEEAAVAENPMVMQSTWMFASEEASLPAHTPFSNHRRTSGDETELADSVVQHQPRWRSSMYGVDEEDLDLVREELPPTTEEEEGCRDLEVSNPWTIARMNAPVKPKQTVKDTQLPSPTKSQRQSSAAPQSPFPAATPHRSTPVEPLTPQTSSRNDALENQLVNELQRSILPLPQPVPHTCPVMGQDSMPWTKRIQEIPFTAASVSSESAHGGFQSLVSSTSLSGSTVQRRKHHSQQPVKNKPYVPPTPQSDDVWFGQPMRNAPRVSRSPKRPRQQGLPFFPSGGSLSPERSLVLPAAENQAATRLSSENNTDIRDFFGHSRRAQPAVTSPRSSQTQHIISPLRVYAEQSSPETSSPCRPRSIESCPRPVTTAQDMDAVFNLHQHPSPALAPGRVHDRLPFHTTTAPASRARRRRTTDASLQRTKSATLPLNFVPHGLKTHNLSLQTNVSLSSIIQQARNLDMSANSLRWAHSSAGAFDVFSAPIPEQKIIQWVIHVDGMLTAVFGRVDGVDVRCRLHEGVQRFLDTRHAEEEMGTACADNAVDRDAPMTTRNGALRTGHSAQVFPLTRGLPRPARQQSALSELKGGTCLAVSGGEHTAASNVKSDEDENGILSRLGGPDDVVGDQSVLVPTTKVEDDFGDGIDDEMLMDL